MHGFKINLKILANQVQQYIQITYSEKVSFTPGKQNWFNTENVNHQINKGHKSHAHDNKSRKKKHLTKFNIHS